MLRILIESTKQFLYLIFSKQTLHFYIKMTSFHLIKKNIILVCGETFLTQPCFAVGIAESMRDGLPHTVQTTSNL